MQQNLLLKVVDANFSFQAIVLLNTCLDKIYKTFSKKKPLLNKNQIVILCQLGKHEKHRSNQLKEHGKKKEADLLWKQALKVRF